jgi:hypothetical protein
MQNSTGAYLHLCIKINDHDIELHETGYAKRSRFEHEACNRATHTKMDTN